MEVTIASVGINWIWYMDIIDHMDGTCTVNAVYRRHCGRDEHPFAAESGEWIEDSNRNLIGVRWKSPNVTHSASVRNPRHIFSYRDKE